MDMLIFQFLGYRCFSAAPYAWRFIHPGEITKAMLTDHGIDGRVIHIMQVWRFDSMCMAECMRVMLLAQIVSEYSNQPGHARVSRHPILY